MLRNIRIQIILVFLIIGIAVISIMGWMNYTCVNQIIEQVQSGSVVNGKIIYQGHLKTIILFSIFVFSVICIIARFFMHSKNNFANN